MGFCVYRTSYLLCSPVIELGDSALPYSGEKSSLGQVSCLLLCLQHVDSGQILPEVYLPAYLCMSCCIHIQCDQQLIFT